MQLGFYLNSDTCIGCKTCAMACKDIHDLPIGVSYRRVYNLVTGHWEKDEAGVQIPINVFSYTISMSCNHCKEPDCITVCPQKAIKKEPNGTVWIDSEKCVGCRLCAGKCPHGAIQFNRQTGVSEKCDMCRELQSARKEPACVAACPMRCLKIVDIDTWKENDDSTIFFPVGSMTQPSFKLHLNRRIKIEEDKDTSISNLKEEL